MTHFTPPVIKQVPPAEIVPGIVKIAKATPMSVAVALGWVLGTVWAVLQAGVSGTGFVVGSVYLALRTLAFSVMYGFLKGAHIQLVPAEQAKRRPSIPQ